MPFNLLLFYSAFHYKYNKSDYINEFACGIEGRGGGLKSRIVIYRLHGSCKAVNVDPRQWMEDVLVRISEYERSGCSYRASSEPLDSNQPKSGVKDPTWNYLEQKRLTWNQVVPGWQNRPQVAYLVKKYINQVVLNRRLFIPRTCRR